MVPRLAQQLAEDLARRSLSVLQPFLTHLDRQLDVRLVRTLAASVLTIIRHLYGLGSPRASPSNTFSPSVGSFLNCSQVPAAMTPPMSP